MNNDIKEEIKKIKEERKKEPRIFTLGANELDNQLLELYKKEYNRDSYNCYFCWLDILGYKNQVDKDPSDIYARLKKAIEVDFDIYLKKAKKDLKKVNLSSYKDFVDIEIFSDAIMIKAPIHINENNEYFISFLIVINIIFSCLFINDIFVRGAISYGKHAEENFNYNYANGKVVVSPALIRAYTLESEKAKYSRIIIDKYFLDDIKLKDYYMIKSIIEDNVLLIDTFNNIIIFNLKIVIASNIFYKKYTDKYNEFKDENPDIALKYKYMIDLLDFQKSNYTTNKPDANFKFRRMEEADFI